MEASINFKSKKALKEAVAAGKKVSGRPMGLERGVTDGSVVISGPWYPQPYRWYAQCIVKNGYIISVK